MEEALYQRGESYIAHALPYQVDGIERNLRIHFYTTLPDLAEGLNGNRHNRNFKFDKEVPNFDLSVGGSDVTVFDGTSCHVDYVSQIFLRGILEYLIIDEIAPIDTFSVISQDLLPTNHYKRASRYVEMLLQEGKNSFFQFAGFLALRMQARGGLEGTFEYLVNQVYSHHILDPEVKDELFCIETFEDIARDFYGISLEDTQSLH